MKTNASNKIYKARFCLKKRLYLKIIYLFIFYKKLVVKQYYTCGTCLSLKAF